jgi:hypothetical protein
MDGEAERAEVAYIDTRNAHDAYAADYRAAHERFLCSQEDDSLVALIKAALELKESAVELDAADARIRGLNDGKFVLHTDDGR